MSIKYKPVTVTINDVVYGPIDVPQDLLIIEFLHEYVALTGSRMGCGQGICHACVVILDHPNGESEELRTCITGIQFLDGKKIRTVEGHAVGSEYDKKLSDIQQAFIENFSFQCGYCAPGFINAATVFAEKLMRNPIKKSELEDEIVEALNHHICRCTGYVRYYAAVKDVVLKTPGLIKDD